MCHPTCQPTPRQEISAEFATFVSWVKSLFRRRERLPDQLSLLEAEERGYLRGINDAAEIFETQCEWMANNRDAARAIRCAPRKRSQWSSGAHRLLVNDD